MASKLVDNERVGLLAPMSLIGWWAWVIRPATVAATLVACGFIYLNDMDRHRD